LAKKLKKKIEEICGLLGLDSEARQTQAKAILASSEWKQQLCNELIGLSFRELEHTLNSVASERHFKDENEKQTKTQQKGVRSKLPSQRRSLEEILKQVHSPRVHESQPSLAFWRGFQRNSSDDRETENTPLLSNFDDECFKPQK